MALSLTEVDGLLKAWYTHVDNGPTEQLPNSNVFLAQLERETDKIDAQSNKAQWGLHTGRNGGGGFLVDGGTLLTAGSQENIKAEQTLKTVYRRINLTKQAMRAARSAAGALRKAVTSEMKGAIADMRFDVNRACLGTADGVLATCGTTTNSATITLASTTTAVQMRQFYLNQYVDVGIAATPTSVATGRKITAIDTTNKTITVSGATMSTVDGTTLVFTSGGGGGPGTGQAEITGLQYAVKASGTLYNVNPSTYPIHVSTVNANGSVNRPATITLFDGVMNDIYIASSHEGKYLGMCTPAVLSNLAAQMQSQRRYPAERTDLKGGYTGVTVYNGHGSVTFVDDRDVPTGNAFLLAMDKWWINEWQPPDWEQEDDHIFKYVTGTLAYEAVYSWMFDIATDQRNAHARITFITE